jgi:hypothetical protein
MAEAGGVAAHYQFLLDRISQIDYSSPRFFDMEELEQVARRFAPPARSVVRRAAGYTRLRGRSHFGAAKARRTGHPALQCGARVARGAMRGKRLYVNYETNPIAILSVTH